MSIWPTYAAGRSRCTSCRSRESTVCSVRPFPCTHACMLLQFRVTDIARSMVSVRLVACRSRAYAWMGAAAVWVADLILMCRIHGLANAEQKLSLAICMLMHITQHGGWPPVLLISSSLTSFYSNCKQR